MNARQLVVDWVRTASLFNESSDFTMSRMYKFYSDSKTYCDKKAEVITFILDGLTVQEQDDFTNGLSLVGVHILTRDDKMLRDKLNVVKRKMMRLFSQLGNLVYGPEFKRFIGPPFHPKEYNIPLAVRFLLFVLCFGY